MTRQMRAPARGECYTVDCMYARADVDCSGCMERPERHAFAADVRKVGSALVAAGGGRSLHACAGADCTPRDGAQRLAECLVPGLCL